jgi:hypothetical protein
MQEVCGAHRIIPGFPDEGMDRSTHGGVLLTSKNFRPDPWSLPGSPGEKINPWQIGRMKKQRSGLPFFHEPRDFFLFSFAKNLRKSEI